MASSEPRALRADAERNRRRVLDAARQVFAEHGLAVGVDAVARAAGVGVGTLYRRFPTKMDLLTAVIEDGVSRLADEVEALSAVEDPWEAFAQAVGAFAGAIARDRGFYEVIHGSPEYLALGVESKQRLIAALDRLLHRAQDAGVVRSDVVADDIGALCMVAARLPAWRLESQPELWTRYLALALDGLRPDGAHELPHAPPVSPLKAPKRATPRVRSSGR
jgi:AcrR family transcriptional regulator